MDMSMVYLEMEKYPFGVDESSGIGKEYGEGSLRSGLYLLEAWTFLLSIFNHSRSNRLSSSEEVAGF